jgi:hypothetical protein
MPSLLKPCNPIWSVALTSSPVSRFRMRMEWRTHSGSPNPSMIMGVVGSHSSYHDEVVAHVIPGKCDWTTVGLEVPPVISIVGDRQRRSPRCPIAKSDGDRDVIAVSGDIAKSWNFQTGRRPGLQSSGDFAFSYFVVS